MNVVRSLWASVQGDPKFMRRVNGWFTIFWIVMIPCFLLARLVEQRDLRLGSVALGAGVGPLEHLASRPRRGYTEGRG